MILPLLAAMILQDPAAAGPTPPDSVSTEAR
jgi:hypothetical protein